MSDLPTRYDPSTLEPERYDAWERSGAFAPRDEGAPFSVVGGPFTIVLPPPNVTGVLHLGHAIDHTLQDALIRRARMRGLRTLWLPGTDHAGIATQNVVERQLAGEGLSRHDLGREAFIERVWAWKAESGDTITKQMRRLGDSVDWSRERFTMDEGLSRAVREAFVRLYEQEIIYRGTRITNWCPRCRSAISDIEVEHADVDGELVQLHYPLADGSGHVTVATTRVETMLADTAVAVHPEDERYAGLVGKFVRLPLMHREIPIVADAAVDREFGTGCLKVTPGHDPLDFEIGQRHGLPSITVIDEDGRINTEGGRFAGLDRVEARKAVLEALRAEDAVGEEQRPFTHAVGHCSRCKTEIEPLLSEQWFVKVVPMAAKAIEVVRSGETRFVPSRFERDYLQWMENLRDWCISRQLWWGHRIPVWTCDQGHRFAARTDPSTCTTCGSATLEQDPDVLDTWFSSALWPFSTLGWPEDTQDLRDFYPTDVLATGYDIITFWVSRMLMMGCWLMPEAPFHTVYIHGMVRDFRGKKMSKSFGNALDPLELIDRYGADALRMTLARGATLGSDVPIDEKWIEGDRNFCTKLWNLTRFAMLHQDRGAELPPSDRRTLADRWILSRLDAVTAEVDDAFEGYDLARAAQTLRQFAWTEFADWYVEWSKGRLYGEDTTAKGDTAAVLEYTLERLLRLLHPFAPFITDELWRTLTGGETVMIAAWPVASGLSDSVAEQDMGFLQQIVSAIRRFKADHEIAPSVKPSAVAIIEDRRLAELADAERERICALAAWGALIIEPGEPAAMGVRARLVIDGATIEVPLEGLLDLDEERKRLRAQQGRHAAEIARIEGKLGNHEFVAKAPEDVVEQQRERLGTERELLGSVEAALGDLG